MDHCPCGRFLHAVLECTKGFYLKKEGQETRCINTNHYGRYGGAAIGFDALAQG